MKSSIIILITIICTLTSCKSNDMKESKIVSISIDINANSSEVWNLITSKDYAKELGSVFDKNAFVESDWKLGSEVHFKYEPNKIVSTGIITKLIENELIQVEYDFSGFKYEERYTIEESNTVSKLAIYAGPYISDFEAQKIVWKSWLLKVKELSEK
ncbi:hypothetical protein H2O64_18555 [Kordia sp. YSTF-M3]|uniref:SRPBCC family protein n=1 Tax=Kordia aestuariivivens TaxID=2759037 RepID=A0ABR7QE67_9FLAO|nr:hypothetical protein [Kordia aestuariivivens]MBC8756681.1 hypothetical protein [Kordia aestuariivivens]